MERDIMVLNFRHRPRNGEWEDVEQVISFAQTPCHYGGYRKWFLCPRCDKRVAILYGTGKYFLCRHCCQLTYDSCNASPLQRFFDKANKLKKQLGGDPGMAYPVATRPKGMHRSTYNRIVAEIYQLEDLGDQGMMDKWGVCF